MTALDVAANVVAVIGALAVATMIGWLPPMIDWLGTRLLARKHARRRALEDVAWCVQNGYIADARYYARVAKDLE
jgi:hypothetical protein